MISRFSGRLVLALFLMALSCAALAKGRLGFGVEVSTESMLSQTLTQVKVSSVRPDSPAELAGLKAGDIITQLAGQVIAGSKGKALKAKLDSVKQGERLPMVVLRDGKSLAILIVAGPER